MWDKDTSAFLTGQEASRPMWDRTVEHIEKLSKSKTKIGMVWLKLIILETIAGVLDNLVNWRKFCQIFKICPHSALPRPARWLLTPRWVDLERQTVLCPPPVQPCKSVKLGPRPAVKKLSSKPSVWRGEWTFSKWKWVSTVDSWQWQGTLFSWDRELVKSKWC